jgi:hypothetical protein
VQYSCKASETDCRGKPCDDSGKDCGAVILRQGTHRSPVPRKSSKEAKKKVSSMPVRETWLCLHLDFGLPVTRTVRQ